MVDAHCHLTDKKYAERSINELVDGLELVISNGTTVEDSKKAIEAAEKYPQVYATTGVHPDEKTDYINNRKDLKKLLIDISAHPRIVAIGEAALDYFEGISPEEQKLQREMFEIKLEAAKETELPLVVHNRNADEEILEYLKDFNGGIQLHCFVEKLDYAKEAVSRGWYLSFGGVVTFKNSGYLREIVKWMPLEQLLIETDAPYLAPEPIRGSVNEPKNVKIVAEAIAQIRDVPMVKLESIIFDNTKRLFKKII